MFSRKILIGGLLALCGGSLPAQFQLVSQPDQRREVEVQRLKDLRDLLAFATDKREDDPADGPAFADLADFIVMGRASVNVTGGGPASSIEQLFKRVTAAYQSHGYGRIAAALRYSLPTLRELANAERPSDVNRPRARRAIRRVLNASLANQPIVMPDSTNVSVPFYTVIAVHYGDQLARAYQNVTRSRPATKSFGKTPRDLWLKSDNEIMQMGSDLMIANAYPYVVSNSGSSYYGSITTSVSGTFGVTGEVDISPQSITGTLVALPTSETPPVAARRVYSYISTGTLVVGPKRYDLTVVPTDPPYRLYDIPTGTDVPETAIVIPFVTP